MDKDKVDGSECIRVLLTPVSTVLWVLEGAVIVSDVGGGGPASPSGKAEEEPGGGAVAPTFRLVGGKRDIANAGRFVERGSENSLSDLNSSPASSKDRFAIDSPNGFEGR